MRAAITSNILGAIAVATPPTKNSKAPIAKIFFLPTRSDQRPKGKSNTETVKKFANINHCAVSRSAEKSMAITGIATSVTLAVKTVIKVASITMIKTI